MEAGFLGIRRAADWSFAGRLLRAFWKGVSTLYLAEVGGLDNDALEPILRPVQAPKLAVNEFETASMSNYVDITFDCLPLRAVSRLDAPLDDDDSDEIDFALRVRRAVSKHGQFNTYYLHNAQCVFHLTNDEKIGVVSFRFEGTVLADSDDLKTLDCDLEIELNGEVCDWLTATAVDWLKDSVAHAVRVEFDRYIHAGDLQRTLERMEKVRAESDAHGGYLGMGL
jgi:hypothetical protein